MLQQSKSTIIAMIPARVGSTRLKMKNLALINGKPMISYVVEASKKSGVFNRIVINSDGLVYDEIAKRHGVEFYKRPEFLGSSITKSDDVVLNFIENYSCDIIVWVNPISPLQPPEEIRKVVKYFIQEKLDTLITVKTEQVHANFNDLPVNYTVEGKFAQTQDLIPIQPFVYSIMMWNSDIFKKTMKNKRFAFFIGKVGFYPVCKESTIIIKTEEDLRFADYIQRVKTSGVEPLQYDPIAKGILQKY
jgi:CMP-N-acetylneuraminic acid synthetase